MSSNDDSVPRDILLERRVYSQSVRLENLSVGEKMAVMAMLGLTVVVAAEAFSSRRRCNDPHSVSETEAARASARPVTADNVLRRMGAVTPLDQRRRHQHSHQLQQRSWWRRCTHQLVACVQRHRVPTLTVVVGSTVLLWSADAMLGRPVQRRAAALRQAVWRAVCGAVLPFENASGIELYDRADSAIAALSTDRTHVTDPASE